MRPFEPIGNTVKVTATTGGTDRVALPAVTTVTKRRSRIFNTGTVLVFVNFGSSTVTASAASNHPILPGSFQEIMIPPSATHMAAVAASTTADVYVTEGF